MVLTGDGLGPKRTGVGSRGQRIAVAGAGMSGAYLCRRLRNLGCHVEVFTVDPGTPCGVASCAWGTSRGFQELVAAAGLDPGKYILRRFDSMEMDGVAVRSDLLTFDKPGVVRDLLDQAEVRCDSIEQGGYDRIIDATGVVRAYLPEIGSDIVMPCVQYRSVMGEQPGVVQVKLGNIGYAWRFPLAPGTTHVGCGSLTRPPRAVLEEIGWAKALDRNDVVCKCTGKIRLTGPGRSRPFVTRNDTGEIWGVGEAIGCVAPIAGDGVVPGMKSVQILLENWDDPEGYTAALLAEFDWMERERRLLDKLIRGQRLGLVDAIVLRRNAGRMGIRMGWGNALRFAMRL